MKLGTGGFGDVYLVRGDVELRAFAVKHRMSLSREVVLGSSDTVAIKTYKPRKDCDTKLQQQYENEKLISIIASDLGIGPVVFTDVFDEGARVLVMERLMTTLHPTSFVPQNNVLDLSFQLVSALQRLHAEQYVHCDIKPNNVMLNFDHALRLVDWGLSRRIDKRVSFCSGTPEFAPPEVLRSVHRRNESLPATAAMDWWSAGCTIYEISTGTRLFPGRSHAEVLAKIDEYERQGAESSLGSAERFAALRQLAPTTVVRLLSQLLRVSPDRRGPQSSDVAPLQRYPLRSKRGRGDVPS